MRMTETTRQDEGDTAPTPDPLPPHRSSRSASKLTWRELHLWQMQPVRDILLILVIIGVVYLGYLVRIVTTPLLLAMLLAYLFEPVVSWLTKRWRLGRQTAVTAILVATVLFVVVPTVLAAAFGLVQAAGAAGTIASNTRTLLASVESETPETRAQAFNELEGKAWQDLSIWLTELKDGAKRRRSESEGTRPDPTSQSDPISQPDLAGATDLPAQPATTPQATTSADSSQATSTPPEEDDDGGWAPTLLTKGGQEGIYRLSDMALRWIGNNAEVLAASIGRRAIGTGADAVSVALRTLGSIGLIAFTAFLTAFFFFFISTGYGKVLEFWRDLIPDRKQGKVIDLASKMNVAVSGFVRGRLTIAAIQAIFFSVGYLLIGVPGWLLLGPLVAILSIVPYAALIGVPISMLLLYLEPNALAFQDTLWWTLLAPLAVYFGGQALDDYVLTPTIQGKSTGMDTPTILFASLAGGALAGVYGLLLAIPVAACIKILLQELFWPRFKRWAQGKERDFLPIND